MELSLDAAETLIGLSPADDAARPRLMQLVARLHERDARLMDRLLRELLPCVRRWTFRMLGPNGELDDATQDAMSEIASALHRFEGRSSVATLAHAIVVRTSYRFFRRRSTRGTVPLDLDEPADARPDPERQAEAREALAFLYEKLAALPEKRRVAFVLCMIEGLGPAEAAEIAGCSALAMRTRLFHARAEVEAAMRAHDGRRA